MRNLCILFVLLLAACAPAPVQTPIETAYTPAAASTPTPAPLAETPIPTPLPLPTATVETASAPASVEYAAGALWVRLFSPTDETVVNAPQVTVSGQAPPDTIISINDEILIVPSEQFFSVDIPLDEGANVLEFIASDINGNEVTFVLTVIYEP